MLSVLPGSLVGQDSLVWFVYKSTCLSACTEWFYDSCYFFSAQKAVCTSVMTISKLKFWVELDNICNLKTNYFSDRKQDTVPYISVYHNNSFLGLGDGSAVGKMAPWLRGLAVRPEVQFPTTTW